MYKVIAIFGTRPEAIKMAPVIQELKKHHHIETKIIVTAQHREMLDQVLEYFDIVPDYDLNIMKVNQTLVGVTTAIMQELEALLIQEKPNMILVHGDTTTAFTSAMTAYYHQISVAHVEAGLRTNNKYSPFPEEANRQLIGVLADLHFAPTNQAKQNLLEEGKPLETIIVTGNTSIDALMKTVNDDYRHPLIDSIRQKQRRMILLTAHRRENFGESMQNIFMATRDLVEAYDDIEVVFPVHLNPLIKQLAKQVLGDLSRVHLIPPLDVIDFHNFLGQSYLVLTDSGGIQEEAPSLGVPVLVMRDTTERPEGVEVGTLKLVGCHRETIVAETSRLLDDLELYKRMASASNPYGDGQASIRIVNKILESALSNQND
ncbi:UDP-N-acetylglucosamine 2-epimerase (non-hydrolyzing) [Exiguobacterium sp. s6]|uniref:non-hydrolyzing UDP-N-acetylglucosamine 2-epimerase n=1 Tax=Exiguobacterium sp. s6 TaxID=2751236 RepID=UPI001BE649F2|nr:UDP-N-acetylglucosamine 2-epimerase (non-hydrolyzing) [Exiguobacterium sp. s6]